MAKATNEQVQRFVNERIRVRSEQIRELLLAMESDRDEIDDVYANLSDTPDWTDDRTDGPPHLLSASDVLGINAFMADIITAMREHGQLPVVMDACVRPVDLS